MRVMAILGGLLLLSATPLSFTDWIVFQERVSVERMLRNISPPGTVAGTVIASPSRSDPDYYFHWTRDAALVMDQVVQVSVPANLRVIRDYVLKSRQEQLAPSAEGLGEVRFRVDGTPDTLPWARPQYDGPALRALTLIRLLDVLPLGGASSEEALVRREALNVIRVDLDFVAKYWRKPSFDLWEEVKGLHFYTQAAQYAALLAGAQLWESENKPALAAVLRREAGLLEPVLESYWDSERRIIRVSQEVQDRPGYKLDGLDTAVVLAALHTRVEHGILSVTDDRLLSTAHALEQAFAREYTVSLAIGRFTDDVYFGGNPWYLTTAAFADLYYRVASAIERSGEIVVTRDNAGFLGATPGTRVVSASPEGKELLTKLRSRGDGFLSTIRKYAGSQGEMAEQFDRDAGVPVSAYDLTWSYAAFLSAARERR